MSKLIIKFTSILAVFILSAGLLPRTILADINYEVSDNGSGSTNEVSSSQTQNTTLDQANTANINNNVTISTNTGNNTASGNTGGDTSIETGDTSVSTNITNTANTNVSSVNNCCTGDSTGTISGNGSDSTNTLSVNGSNNTSVTTTNQANINNQVTINANTGNNYGSGNTDGNVSIRTGNVRFIGSISNTANSNLVRVSGGNSSDFNADISGNGTGSDNEIDLGFDNDVDIQTRNFSNIYNRVFFNLNTGGNRANDNTDGDVVINTGDIFATLDINNQVNTNVVTVTNCCATVSPTPTQPDDNEDDDDDEDDGEDNDDDDDGDDSDDEEPVAERGGPGGQILGLSPTSGDPTPLFYLLAALGMLSLILGSVRLASSNPMNLAKTPLLPQSKVSFKFAWQDQNPNILSLSLQLTLTPKGSKRKTSLEA